MKYKLMKCNAMFSLAVLGTVAMIPSQVQAQELVTNGGFETSTGGNGQVDFNTSLSGWSVSGGYTFLFSPGAGTSGTTADTTGADGQYGNLGLWGPGNGVANGLTNSPTGGNFIAQDSAFQQSPITQTISGLTIGQTYNLNFDWAAAQQLGFDGDTFDQWQVTLGSEQHNTSTVNLSSHGFSGWMHENFQYTATSSSETLSFFAAGGPPGVPPFALLDGVSLQAVPEAGTGMAVMTGLMGFSAFARRRARSRARSAK